MWGGCCCGEGCVAGVAVECDCCGSVDDSCLERQSAYLQCRERSIAFSSLLPLLPQKTMKKPIQIKISKSRRSIFRYPPIGGRRSGCARTSPQCLSYTRRCVEPLAVSWGVAEMKPDEYQSMTERGEGERGEGKGERDRWEVSNRIRHSLH